MPRKAGRGGLSRHGEKGCLVVCTLAFLAVFLFAVFLFAKDADGKQVCDRSSGGVDLRSYTGVDH